MVTVRRMTEESNPDARLDAPAFHRNIRPIIAAFRQTLDLIGVNAMEIGCGSGQHAAALAEAFPDTTWWPTDQDARYRLSAESWRRSASLDNLRQVAALDASDQRWPLGEPDHAPDKLELIYAFNVIHISPWKVAQGIIAGAARHLTTSGALVLYGPFMIDGQHTAASNAAFDQSLRSRDPDWGVRNLDDVKVCARENGLSLEHLIPMPSNNFTVIFRRETLKIEP